jgi:hypothetical protein
MLSTLLSADDCRSSDTKDEPLLDPLRGEMDGLVEEYSGKRAREAIATAR